MPLRQSGKFIFIILFFAFSCKTIIPSNFSLLFGSYFVSTVGQGSIVYAADSFLFTSESGRQAEFAVRLNIEPNSSVRLGPISISDSTESRLLSSTYIEFDSDNWNEPQYVRFAGVDDIINDGNQNYLIYLGSLQSSDIRFQNNPTPILLAVNTDDETSGVAASPNVGLITSENGESGTIAYVLQTRPMRPVIIRNFISLDMTEATVESIELIFTPDNWFIPQTVIVTGVDDFSIEDSTFQITADPSISEDPSYQGKSIPIITGTNVDNDTAGFTVVNLAGLTVSESGNSTNFAVVMNTLPTNAVTISSLSPTPATEGNINPTSIVFQPNEWFTPKIVTIAGVDDFIADGNQTVNIVSSVVSSSDTDYNGLAGPVFPSLTNLDDDVPGFVLTSPGNFVISENGGLLHFGIRLSSQPPPGFTVTLSGISENNAITNISTNSIVFNSSNWNVDQNITITTNNNFVDEDTRNVLVNFGSVLSGGSADPVYNAISPPSSITIQVTDDDSAGIVVSPTSGLTVDENAGPLTTTFTVVLSSEPTGNVSIPSVNSNDTSEITVSPSSLIFTQANWNIAQAVTLSSVVDGVTDGNKNVNITFANATSVDPKYNALVIPAVTATNIDSLDPIVRIQNLSASTMPEDGSTIITVEIRLTILPASNVVITPIASSDNTEAVLLSSTSGVSPTRTLTFTTNTGEVASYSGNSSQSGWNVPQIIRIRSVADSFDDGNIPVQIQFPNVSGSFYAGKKPDDNGSIPAYDKNTGILTITVIDNDTAGFIISNNTLNLSEAGGNESFTVRLNSAPCNTPSNRANCTSGSLTIPISSETFSLPDTTQYTYTPSSLTFNESNFGTTQAVTVTPANDAIDETNIRSHTLTLGMVTGSGTDYDGLKPSNVSINITDDDNPNPKILFVLKSGEPYFTTESGINTKYELRLGSQPLVGNSVTVTLSSSDGTEGRIKDGGSEVISKQFVFDSSNWSTAIEVQISGQSDDGDTTNIGYTVSVSGTESGTNPFWYVSYLGSTGATANLVNYSLDTNPITVVTPTSMTMAENAAPFPIYILLNQMPTDDVSIPITLSDSFPCRLIPSLDLRQFNISSNSLTITPANWNTIGVHNTVTVTPNNDDVDDGNINCPILVGAVSSNDLAFHNYDPPNPTLTLNDNDTAGFTTSGFSPNSIITSQSGASSEFYINLNTQPTADVTINFITNPAGVVSFLSSPLVFTPINFNSAQTVQLQGINNGSVTDSNYTVSSDTTSVENSTFAINSATYNEVSAISLPALHIYYIYDLMPCLDPSIVSVCSSSPDPNGGLVSSPILSTTELGGEARYQIRLRARPISDVTISVSSSNLSEGNSSVSNIIFTPNNWNVFQNIVMTGVDDFINDGNANYNLIFGSMSGGGTGFNGEILPVISLINTDND
ncbi:hypothetical protein P3G55_10945 [Leptospira sp. 96542]|nr:hypothetical protein [Leptospira sp. 96542]